MAGLAGLATALGLFLALSWVGLWLSCRRSGAPSGWFSSACAAGGGVAIVRLRLPTVLDGPAPARPQQRRAAPSGHRDRRCMSPRRRGSVRARSGAPMWSGRCCGASVQGRMAVAPACRCAILWRCARWCSARRGHLLRRRRRALEARRRRVRLAGRRDAGELPHRRLGHAAGLYRPAAAHPCRACARPGRYSAGNRTPMAVPAGSQLVVRATGKVNFEIVRQRRHRSRPTGGSACAAAGRHRGAPLHHQRRPAPPPLHGGSAAMSSGPSTPSRTARRRSRSPRSRSRSARLAAARLQDRRRLRRRRSAGDLRAQAMEE